MRTHMNATEKAGEDKKKKEKNQMTHIALAFNSTQTSIYLHLISQQKASLIIQATSLIYSYFLPLSQ